MVNKRLLMIGLLIAVMFGGATFYLSSSAGVEPPREILAARTDLPAGTRVSDLSEEAFARFQLAGDETLLSSYLTESAWEQIQRAGGVLVRDISRHEAVPLAAIASDGNPIAVEIPRLGLTDPTLVVVSLTGVQIPTGIRVGDHVDLVVAVERAQAETFTLLQPPLEPAVFEPLGDEPAEAPEEVSGGTPSAASTWTATPAPTLTPTPTPTPTLSPAYPLAKVIVRSARIAGISREQPPGSRDNPSLQGKVTGVDVVIPREAQEFVLMSDTAGQLGLSLLSPMLERDSDHGPTLGAHFEDLLDLFAADRQELAD